MADSLFILLTWQERNVERTTPHRKDPRIRSTGETKLAKPRGDRPKQCRPKALPPRFRHSVSKSRLRAKSRAATAGRREGQGWPNQNRNRRGLARTEATATAASSARCGFPLGRDNSGRRHTDRD